MLARVARLTPRWRRITDPASPDAKLVPILAAIGIAGAIGLVLLLAAVITPGADGHPVAAARFHMPRDGLLLGRRMLLLAVAGSTILLVIVLPMLGWMIGRLAVGRPADPREQIEVQSVALARSESAVAAMHNVRNALTPITTILGREIARPPPVDRGLLDRAIGELAQGDVLPARRQKLAAFVAAAMTAEAQRREAVRRELAIGHEAVAQVLEIIGQQQKDAHQHPAPEPCDVSAIIAGNATIARYSAMVPIAFSSPSEAQWAMADRVILSQVIGNLLGNAAEAIAAAGRSGGLIAVSVHHAGERVELHIRDDGEGFAAEVGATLFQRGFSTRAGKSGGLGLHWCAKAMAAMGGSLRLESEGRGRGAVAILTLRAARSAVVAKAA